MGRGLENGEEGRELKNKQGRGKSNEGRLSEIDGDKIISDS